MKALIQIIIVGMFGVEVCSPFMIGYLDQKEKRTKSNTEFIKKRKTIDKIYQQVASASSQKNWKNIDFSADSYSDSKALRIKE